jgi:competence protein ComEC
MRRLAKLNSTKVLGIAILVALFFAGLIWYAVLQEDRGGLLRVSFLDIGQGDSVFIESPDGRQVLIDGGPDSTVIRRLGEVMPWYDRSLDVVIGTHPDADHIGGLIDVFARYKTSLIVRSSVLGATATWNAFEKSAKAEGAQIVTAQRGQIIDLDDGAYLEVLFPDRSVPNLETNTGCVVTRLVYGQTSFLLSCDAPQAVENYLVGLDGARLRSSVLKAGHHGSKTSSSPLFLGFVNPEYAVFSRGCDNKYGHPSKETVERFATFGIPTKDTCEQGTVTFVSDGKNVALR